MPAGRGLPLGLITTTGLASGSDGALVMLKTMLAAGLPVVAPPHQASVRHVYAKALCLGLIKDISSSLNGIRRFHIKLKSKA